MAEVRTPDCPLCGQPPVMTLPGGIQAFCGTDGCTLICWNPSLSLDENLMDAGLVQFPEEGGGSDGTAERETLN